MDNIVNRVAAAAVLLALLGVAACQTRVPLSPTKDATPGATHASDWCGTDRMGRWLRMDERRFSEAEGGWRRLFVRHTGQGWALVTERGTYGSVETTEEESALPGGIEGKPDSKQIRAWIDQLRDHDEEVVFRAALALGAHGVHEAVRHLCFYLQSDGHAFLEFLFPPKVDPHKRQRPHHALLAAAIALGQIKSADAVRPLFSDGLVYKHVLVRRAVREALHSITGNEISISDRVPESSVGRSGQSREEWITMRLQEEWDKWWEENEDAVRTKLKKGKQPVSPPPKPKRSK